MQKKKPHPGLDPGSHEWDQKITSLKNPKVYTLASRFYFLNVTLSLPKNQILIRKMLHYTIAPFCMTRQKREYSNTQIWSSYETDKTFSFKFDFNFNLNSQSTFHEHRKSSNNLRCWRATEAFIRRPQVREMHTWAMQKKRTWIEIEVERCSDFRN